MFLQFCLLLRKGDSRNQESVTDVSHAASRATEGCSAARVGGGAENSRHGKKKLTTLSTPQLATATFPCHEGILTSSPSHQGQANPLPGGDSWS